jgi:hypothetical protein
MNKANDMIDMLNEENRVLTRENAILKRSLTDLQNFCMNFASDHNDIDFPNSKKGGFEGSNIFTM